MISADVKAIYIIKTRYKRSGCCIYLTNFYKKQLQTLKCNLKRACIFYLILVGILSILILSVRTGVTVFFAQQMKSVRCDESYLLTVPKRFCLFLVIFFFTLALTFPFRTCFKKLPVSVLYSSKNDAITYDLRQF